MSLDRVNPADSKQIDSKNLIPLCSLSHQPIRKVGMTSCQCVFELEVIQQWFSKGGKTCPSCKKNIPTITVPNPKLQETIDSIVKLNSIHQAAVLQHETIIADLKRQNQELAADVKQQVEELAKTNSLLEILRSHEGPNVSLSKTAKQIAKAAQIENARFQEIKKGMPYFIAWHCCHIILLTYDNKHRAILRQLWVARKKYRTDQAAFQANMVSLVEAIDAIKISEVKDEKQSPFKQVKQCQQTFRQVIKNRQREMHDLKHVFDHLKEDIRHLHAMLRSLSNKSEYHLQNIAKLELELARSLRKAQTVFTDSLVFPQTASHDIGEPFDAELEQKMPDNLQDALAQLEKSRLEQSSLKNKLNKAKLKFGIFLVDLAQRLNAVTDSTSTTSTSSLIPEEDKTPSELKQPVHEVKESKSSVVPAEKQAAFVKAITDSKMANRFDVISQLVREFPSLLEMQLFSGFSQGALLTSLFTSICDRDANLVKLLLELGADPNQTYTTIHPTDPSKNTSKNTMLIGVTGSLINSHSDDDRTQFREIFKILLASPCIEVNRANEYKVTALHYAASDDRQLDHVFLLLQQGANLYLKDNTGHTALDYAGKNKLAILKFYQLIQEKRAQTIVDNEKMFHANHEQWRHLKVRHTQWLHEHADHLNRLQLLREHLPQHDSMLRAHRKELLQRINGCRSEQDLNSLAWEFKTYEQERRDNLRMQQDRQQLTELVDPVLKDYTSNQKKYAVLLPDGLDNQKLVIQRRWFLNWKKNKVTLTAKEWSLLLKPASWEEVAKIVVNLPLDRKHLTALLLKNYQHENLLGNDPAGLKLLFHYYTRIIHDIEFRQLFRLIGDAFELLPSQYKLRIAVIYQQLIILSNMNQSLEVRIDCIKAYLASQYLDLRVESKKSENSPLTHTLNDILVKHFNLTLPRIFDTPITARMPHQSFAERQEECRNLRQALVKIYDKEVPSQNTEEKSILDLVKNSFDQLVEFAIQKIKQHKEEMTRLGFFEKKPFRNKINALKKILREVDVYIPDSLMDYTKRSHDVWSSNLPPAYRSRP